MSGLQLAASEPPVWEPAAPRFFETPAGPLCSCRATEVSGNRQGFTRSSVSPRRDIWECLGSALPDGGALAAVRGSPPHSSTPGPLPLTLTFCRRAPPDSLGSKVNTAATHQTRFRSPVSSAEWQITLNSACWNAPFEFLQIDRRASGRREETV